MSDAASFRDDTTPEGFALKAMGDRHFDRDRVVEEASSPSKGEAPGGDMICSFPARLDSAATARNNTVNMNIINVPSPSPDSSAAGRVPVPDISARLDLDTHFHVLNGFFSSEGHQLPDLFSGLYKHAGSEVIITEICLANSDPDADSTDPFKHSIIRKVLSSDADSLEQLIQTCSIKAGEANDLDYAERKKNETQWNNVYALISLSCSINEKWNINVTSADDLAKKSLKWDPACTSWLSEVEIQEPCLTRVWTPGGENKWKPAEITLTIKPHFYTFPSDSKSGGSGSKESRLKTLLKGWHSRHS